MRLKNCAATVAVAIVATGFALIGPSTASAQEADAGALQACDAVETAPGVGYVPPDARGVAYIPAIQTSRGTFTLLCGDGQASGAVHIQLKHAVGNWSETTSCIQKTIGLGRPTDQVGRTRYDYAYPGGTASVAVNPETRTVETAFTAAGAAIDWTNCAAV